MLEASILQLLIFSLVMNIVFASFSLLIIIAFTIVIYRKNHISAGH